MKNLLVKIKFTGKSFLQRLIITLQMFGENGLANHASACAYGFLLSIAPMLLLITFFIFIIFKPSQGAIVFIVGNIPFIGNLFDSQWLSSDFFNAGTLGISGIVSILSIFWAGRILALSMQRAFADIFPADKKRNPVADTLVTLAITASVFLLVLLVIFSSTHAMRFFRFYPPLAENRILQTITAILDNWVSPVVLLAAASFLTYLLVPVNSPKKSYALQGSLLFTIFYFCVSFVLGIILDTSRYNFIYGTFGNLIFLLVNVYFFFMLFFIGAQYAYVIDSFDALLFSKMRQLRINAAAGKSKVSALLSLLFDPVGSSLDKYLRRYKKGEIILSRGDSGDEVYYILEGDVEILLSLDDSAGAGVLNAGSFFGEMGYLLSEDRTVYIKSKTDVCVLVLPPVLFEAVLKNDASLDRDIIEHISRRLKNTTEQLVASNLPNPESA